MRANGGSRSPCSADRAGRWLEVCRRVRDLPDAPAVYLIVLTGRAGRENLVAALGAGADDYLVKPVDPDELRARLRVGQRTVELQRHLARQIHELREALAHVQQLQGLLPICAYCKKIRTDQNYWQQVEDYLALHSHLRFSHGICPVCLERVMATLDTPPLGMPSVLES